MLLLRVLALDVGEKRIGVALSDPSGFLAFPLTTIKTESESRDIDVLIHLVNKYDVDEIVVGLPLLLSGRFGTQANNCHDIFTRDNIAYISEGYSSQYGIYDISDILYPIQLATIPAFGYAHNAWLNEAGTHLITGEETVGMTVKIWDIQDLDNINLVGEYLGENSLAHNVHVKGDFVYISHYTTGLKILDIYDPSDPIEVAAYDTYPDDDNDGFYGCWGAYPFTSNSYVYASDMQYGLFVFEFDDIQAGWVYGVITDENGPVADVEIKSTLNSSIFFSFIWSFQLVNHWKNACPGV